MRRTIKWSIIGVIGVILITFSLVNREAVTFSLFPLPFELHIPLFVLLYITLFVGVVIGEALGFLHSLHFRRELKASQQRVKALESALLLKAMEKTPDTTTTKVLGVN